MRLGSDNINANHIVSPQQQESAEPTVLSATSTRRELSIDIWRGAAVLIMMLTHAIAFFHIGTDSLMGLLGEFGGTVSFTMFLFLSGCAAYLGYIRLETRRSRVEKLLRRTLFLALGYILIAFIATLPTFTFPPGIHWLVNLANIVTFNTIPDFGEFIIPFILFALILVAAKPVFKLITANPLISITVGLAAYAIGQVLYTVPATGYFEVIKEVLVGSGELHRFPMLQYLIIYLLGMQWGRFLSRVTKSNVRFKTAVLASSAYALLLGAAVVIETNTGLTFLFERSFRWPPSLAFILAGLLAGMVTYAIILFTRNLRIIPSGQVLLNYIGNNAFTFFVVHTVVLYAYRYLSADARQDSPILVLLFYVLLVVVSVILTAGVQIVLANLQNDPDNRAGEFGWLLNEKILVRMVWIGVVIIVGLSLFQQRVNANPVNPEEVAFRKRLIREQAWPFWWDHTYNYFHQFTLAGEEFQTLPKGQWYQITFDHLTLVNQGMAKADGSDVRIVYYMESQDNFIEVPIIFSGINSGSATVAFQIEENISAGTGSDKYFLYYGNPAVSTYPGSPNAPSDVRTDIQISGVYQHKLNGTTNRRWILKEGSVSLQLRTLLYTVQLGTDLPADSIVTYKVKDTTNTGRMDNLGDGRYQAAVDVSDLPIGVYRVQASASSPQDRLRTDDSGYTVFYVTYPLYVTWTQDWEGMDVPDTNMAGITALADKYGVPMTHFFNPRIYVTSTISKDRQAAMTLYVQNRQKNYGDEVALHFHMWQDMVAAAGVTPRYFPASSWLYGDAKVSAYTTAEMKQLLNWAKRMFQENGLSVPVSFRAGGWYMGPEAVQALSETGFIIESSGRTYPTVAMQLQDPPPWNLSPTERPYKMNKTDLNSKEQPVFENVWQFPNNGADSYWHSYLYGNQDEMLRRFDLNYPDKTSVLTEPQVLTYLSHPQFFYGTDLPVMDRVFSYVGNYLYKNDAGPVIYTTLENAYYSWDRR
jgi:uncharacterized membrane protein